MTGKTALPRNYSTHTAAHGSTCHLDGQRGSNKHLVTVIVSHRMPKGNLSLYISRKYRLTADSVKGRA